MNRTHIMIGLIVVSSLLAPSMLCLMPGATMTFSEAECCRHMGPDCGDFLMPAHACCKVSHSSGELILIAQAKRHMPTIESAVIDSLPGIHPELQRSRDRNSF